MRAICAKCSRVCSAIRATREETVTAPRTEWRPGRSQASSGSASSRSAKALPCRPQFVNECGGVDVRAASVGDKCSLVVAGELWIILRQQPADPPALDLDDIEQMPADLDRGPFAGRRARANRRIGQAVDDIPQFRVQRADGGDLRVMHDG